MTTISVMRKEWPAVSVMRKEWPPYWPWGKNYRRIGHEVENDRRIGHEEIIKRDYLNCNKLIYWSWEKKQQLLYNSLSVYFDSFNDKKLDLTLSSEYGKPQKSSFFSGPILQIQYGKKNQFRQNEKDEKKEF